MLSVPEAVIVGISSGLPKLEEGLWALPVPEAWWAVLCLVSSVLEGLGESQRSSLEWRPRSILMW